MKGISAVVSGILIISLYLFLTLVALKWAVPIYQKNMGNLDLKKAEYSIYLLKEKIDRAIKLGSVEQYIFDIPGKIEIDAGRDEIVFTLKTRISKYGNNFTCLSENCEQQGILGKDDFFILKANSYKFEDRAIIVYVLKFRDLLTDSELYKIDLVTEGNATLKYIGKSKFIIKNLGERKESQNTTLITLYFGKL